VLTGNEERWANLASLRIFNKSFDALMDDYDKTIGGIPSDTLASLIALGREIEAADASPAQRSRMTRFQKWVVAVLAIAVAGGLWSTRWEYRDVRVGGTVILVRVNRWTGARQVFGCGPVLGKEAQEQVRSLQAQLATIIETWPRKGLAAPAGEPSEPQRRVRTRPQWPINYDMAPQVASELPFSQSADVQRLLQRLKTIEAENRGCGWK